MYETVDQDSPDRLEQELTALEGLVSRIRARQIRLIKTLDSMQVPTADGCRTMTEWVSARLDMHPDTARHLASLAQRIDPQAEEALTQGEASLDRVVAVTRLTQVGIQNAYHQSLAYDLTGVNRWISRHRRITRVDEQQAFNSRYLVLQPNLDESSWRLWGSLPGVDGQLVDQALNHRVDQIPSDITGSRSQKRADALTALCADSLSNGETGSAEDDRTGNTSGGFQITVIVDPTLAVPTGGETGVELLTGPRIGPSGLAEALCSGDLAAFTNLKGQLHRIGTGGNTIPPAIRRYVLARDRGCVIDGCRSRYRLQVHHIQQQAHGGTHDPDNLATVCWYHHHIAIHGQGLQINPHSPPHRRQLQPAGRAPP